MKICETVIATQQVLNRWRQEGKTIGFVPTMGALHQGHLSLVNSSLSENDITVVSIFVNPIQFNNPDDLTKYPRTLPRDLELLQQAGCQLVFTPNEQEVYPNGKPTGKQYDFGALEQVMEGKYRPGHFNGVAVVVKRLFDIVQPHRAYFGEKDFQQLKIIQALVKQENIPVAIVPCAIVREDNGLAMSSRNERLSPENRQKAAIIYQTLQEIKQNYTLHTPQEWVNYFSEKINAIDDFTVEYLLFADENTLQPVTSWESTRAVRAFTSVFCNDVRLIDNVSVTNGENNTNFV